jgi:hypothetical protein
METTASLILAPAIDASLQEMSKRWGQMSDRASILGEETVMQYAFVG